MSFKISKYHSSLLKYLLDTLVIVVFLPLALPILICISVTVFLADGSPVFFIQKRVGQNGQRFKIVKFRTMIKGAEKSQKYYQKLNNADGPVFKIYDDPRFTKIGKILSRTGMDELPQFFNFLKGEMSLVGPRPLPVLEAEKLTNNQKIRELVKPGIVSTWVTGGSHKLKFKKWMQLDKEYVEKGTLLTDLKVIKDSGEMITKNILRYLVKLLQSTI